MTDKPPLDMTEEKMNQMAEENPLTAAAMRVTAQTIGAVMRRLVAKTGGNLDLLDPLEAEELSATALVAGMTAGVATVVEDHQQRVNAKIESPAFDLLMALNRSTAELYVELATAEDAAMRAYALTLSEDMQKRVRAINLFPRHEEASSDD